MTDGVITLDEDQKILQFNRAAQRLFGTSASAAMGLAIGRFIPRGMTNQQNGSDTEGGTRLGGSLLELTGRRADGSEFPIEVSISTIETDVGTLQVAVIRDATVLHAAHADRRARLALEATSRAKTEFLSRMSHELRTPLNAVLGFSQLLRLSTTTPLTDAQFERFRHIDNAGSHLLALVNDVLDLSRVESGNLTLVLEPVNLVSVAERALSMISTMANAARVEVSISPFCAAAGTTGRKVSEGRAAHASSIDDVWVWADEVRLRQVLVNLLSNAVKYNRTGGRVTLAWDLGGGACHITVSDTGPGMSKEKLAHLFEPFNRLGAEKTTIEGTGIGLVLSRRIVEMMHGQLEIDSVVGQGTIATLVLARSDKADEILHVQPSAPSQHGELDGQLRVLYAEDNEVNAELVRQIVTLRPSIVLRIAPSGATALAMAHEERPDLMLVDMNLGDMTGIELAQALNSSLSTADIPLIALSADALPEQVDATLAMGFEAYLTKPIDFKQLLNVLDGHLRPHVPSATIH